ncbi:hypothetical protein HDU76_013643 [Blyttiomyces sp. JEL0837]|nr:hypothetical protein HDU76_013643 [Blyttiomyces sp. JEL0837]
MEDFVALVETAREQLVNRYAAKTENAPKAVVPWAWVASSILQLLAQYPSGLTPSIIFADLESIFELFLKSNSNSKFQPIGEIYRIGKGMTFVMSLHEGDERKCEMFLHRQLNSFRSKLFEPIIKDLVVRFTGSQVFPGGTRQKPLLLGTPLLIPCLSMNDARAKSFINSVFTARLDQLNRDFLPESFNFRAKVVSIGPEEVSMIKSGCDHWVEETLRKSRKIVMKGIEGSDNDGTSHNKKQQKRAQVFYLYDEYLRLTELFAVGDILAFYQPKISVGTNIEISFGESTVIFLIQDEKESMPMVGSHGRKCDRYGLRIIDGTGSVDLTLWDELGHQCEKLQVGQLVFLDRLRASEPKANGSCYVSAAKESDSRIFSVSSNLSMLNSLSLRTHSLLDEAKNIHEPIYCRAVITGWRGPEDKGWMVFSHSKCRRPLDIVNNVHFCSFCAIYPDDDREYSFRVIFSLDDGSATVDAMAGHAAAEVILGISGNLFRASGSEQKRFILDSVVGKEYNFCIAHSKGFKQMKEYQREFLKFAIENNVLTFGSFVLKSGRTSPYFFNAGLFNTGSSIAQVGKYYAAALQDSGLKYDVLFGPAYKGIPLVSSTVVALSTIYKVDAPYSFNRKEKKDHGEGGSIVGSPLKGDVIIIDDVITAGTAIRESVAIIEAEKAKLKAVLILLDRQEKGAGDTTLSAIQQVEKDYGVPVVCIVTLKDVVEYLGLVGGKEKEIAAIRTYWQTYGVGEL